jgi:hypothetical protein
LKFFDYLQKGLKEVDWMFDTVLKRAAVSQLKKNRNKGRKRKVR